MDLEFGKRVWQDAQELLASGRDANQSAKILFDKDPQGVNYGIGIILDGDGKPVPSSQTLTDYVRAELETCGTGTYMNSAKLLEQVKENVLRWQQIPETYWSSFKLALPSDAGTGAVKSAVELLLLLNPTLNILGVEALGWPAHKAIAKMARVAVKEFPEDGVMQGEGILPLYQAGPMNTTGLVQTEETIRARAQSAADSGVPVVLDRAYSGFEFARLTNELAYEKMMQKSYELQLKPFIEAGVPFCTAISPTKAFVTFAFRPCGFLLVYTPDSKNNKQVTTALNSTIRARGSSFEHPITRAFAKAMAHDRERLQKEHIGALKRLEEAEALWRKLVQGTSIESIFSERYAGLFRNPPAKEEAPAAIYGSHLYPVFSQGRCRLNATGLPADEELARKHVAVFAEYCLGS